MKYATPRTENSVCIDTFPTTATIHYGFHYNRKLTTNVSHVFDILHVDKQAEDYIIYISSIHD